MTMLPWHRDPDVSGRPVVLVHAWAQDGTVFTPWWDELRAGGLHALACDLPGHGRAAEMEPPRGVDLARWTADVIGHDLETMGVSHADAVGLAEGGMVVAHLAALGHVDRVVLVAPDTAAPAPHVSEAAAALRDPRARLWSTGAADLVARARVGRGHDRATLARWLDEAAWPAAPRLASIRRPVLVAVGADDPARAAAPRIAALLPEGRVATVPSAGAVWGGEGASGAPSAFVAPIVRFLGKSEAT